MVNTLLTELDGLDDRRGVHVIGATNRPDMVDPAMCRPGRLDKLLFIDLPSADERVEIMRTLSRSLPIAGAEEGRIALEATAKERCDGFSGADLSALVREAGVSALRRAVYDSEGALRGEESDASEVFVTMEDMDVALKKVGPSVTPSQRKRYAAMRSKLAGVSLRPPKDADEEISNRESGSLPIS